VRDLSQTEPLPARRRQKWSLLSRPALLASL